VSSNGISWAVCKSAPRSRQITMPVPHHSVFYRPDALPATQPTASKHWRQEVCKFPNMVVYFHYYWELGKMSLDFWKFTQPHVFCKYSLLCHITRTGQRWLIINITTVSAFNIQTGHRLCGTDRHMCKWMAIKHTQLCSNLQQKLLHTNTLTA